MNPETPQSPREEIEIRITALLLGELSPGEAAALQTQIAADAELTALHARLRRAAGLLREASAIPEQPASEPARLSDERRERLLAHFRGAKSGPVIVEPRRDWKWTVPLGLAASLIALLGGAVFVNGFAVKKQSRTSAFDFSDSDGDRYSAQPAMIRERDVKLRENLALDRSVDELRYASKATKSQSATISEPTPDRSRFFLAAHSRSPELNLAGRPRVTTWPNGTGSVYLPNISDEALKLNSAGTLDSSGAYAASLNKPGVAGNASTSFAGVIAPSQTVATPDSIPSQPAIPEPAAAAPAFVAGSFWDTPRVQTQFDRGVSGAAGSPAFRGGLATSRPGNGEISQYPATPAGSLPVPNAQLDLAGASLGDNWITFNGNSATTGALAKTDSGTLDLNGTSAIVSGTAGLAKTGNGTLILSGANSYAGATAINAGTLQITNGTALNAAGVPATPDATPVNGPGSNGGSGFKIDAGVLTAGTNATLSPAPSAGAEVTFGGKSAYAGYTTTSGGTLQIQKGDFSMPGAMLGSGSSATNKPRESTASIAPGLATGGLSQSDVSAMPERAGGRGDTTRGEISEKPDTSFTIEGAKGDTNRRAAWYDFDFQTGVTFGFAKLSMGDQPASKSIGLGSEQKSGDIRVDYGMPIKDAAGSPAGDGKFQFNAGYKFGRATSEERRKDEPNPTVGAVNSSIADDAAKVNIRGNTRTPEDVRAQIATRAGSATVAERIGRIMFWNDDETAKVNVNTAGGVADPSVPAQLRDVSGKSVAIAKDSSDDATVSGTISGAVSLDKSGAGTWQLGGTNTFTGDGTVGNGNTVTLNGGRPLTLAGSVNSLNTLTVGDVTSGSVITRSGQPARSEVTREFKYAAETNAPEIPKIVGQITVGKAGEGTVRSGGNAPAEQQAFVNAFLNVRKGEEQERAGDLKTAQATLRDALVQLKKIKVESPKWQTELLDFRIKRTTEAAERIGKKLGDAGSEEAAKAGVARKAAQKSAAEEAAKSEMEKAREAERAAPKPAPKPAPSPLEPQPEIRTEANAFSTFSLNVSDVAFKLAAASLEHGAMPDVSTLRTEEFINAFDYRDPEAAPGAPLAFVSERARYPFAQNRDLLRLSVKTAAAGRAPGRPLNIVLLLDSSGSMERADRVRIVREAMRVLSAQLTPQDKLSIVTFARTPRLWADGVAGDKAGEVTARVGEITPEGGTNLAAALDLGYATALKHYQPGSINHVVVLTDGAANLGDVDPAALKQKVETHRKQGVALDCFGIGWEGLNDDMLEQLTRNGDGRYGFINSPEEAATNFAAQLAGALRVAASDVKVQVEWNPKRVTTYRQIGYAKHQLTKEQFRDNTVDAAELGAAESGNALYIVEVNPQGTGDLGTVRVRFKVPGTSDYREHEWAVPFTANAAPLEQSSSTLRLAGTAAAFCEMLASSPFATEVTSDRLLALLNGVPEIYGADPRPKKLEWMIRQAKSLSGR